LVVLQKALLGKVLYLYLLCDYRKILFFIPGMHMGGESQKTIRKILSLEKK
jgi:hypothetical protein